MTIALSHDGRQRAIAIVAAACLLVVLSIGWWRSARFQPPPSIFDTPVDGVLEYLTIDDFSQLPLKERMDFMLALADRFRSFSSGDSVAMSAFVAGVTGPARKQAEENIRILAKDALAEAAAGYFALPADQRGAFIDDWVCDWIRFGERAATGKESTKSDKEILDGINRQASREGERAERIGNIPALDTEGALGFLGFFSSQVQGTASPKEQGQIASFLDDVRGHFSPVF